MSFLNSITTKASNFLDALDEGKSAAESLETLTQDSSLTRKADTQSDAVDLENPVSSSHIVSTTANDVTDDSHDTSGPMTEEDKLLGAFMTHEERMGGNGGMKRAKGKQDGAVALREKIKELTAENAQLRDVWNETRVKLSKLREILNKKTDAHKDMMNSARLDFEEERHQLAKQHSEELLAIQSKLVEQETEFQEALALKEQGYAAERVEMSSLSSETGKLQSKIDSLLQEREEMLALQEATYEQHQSTLKKLKDEEATRMEALATESKVYAESIQAVHSRESNLEEDNLQAISALANTQRDLEDKSRELQRAIAAKQWVEADQAALSNQMDALKQRLQAAQKTHESEETSLRAALRAVTAKQTELQTVIDAKDRLLREAHAESKQLQLTNENATSELKREHDIILSQCQHLTQVILEKQKRIEHLSMERSSLQIQLESIDVEFKQLNSKYKAARRELEQERAGDLERGIQGVTSGGLKLRKGVNQQQHSLHVGTREIKSQTVVRAVSILDNLGNDISKVIRRNPTIRVIIALYVVLIHVFSMFIMYHFATEMPEIHDSANLPAS